MSVEPAGLDSRVAAADHALVRDARHGDRSAFDALVNRYGPDMYRYATRLLGSEADAAEAVQEAFVSAWKGIAGFEGRSAVRTWLFRLVHRRAVDLQRRTRPVPVDDTVIAAYAGRADSDPLQQVMDAELLAALQQALGEIGETQRAVWLLREVEEMSYAEIAETLSMTHDSVRGVLHRARAELSERLKTWR
ncbi:MAG: polymerase ECF-type sigma factor [Nocardioidaceae bacterium]|nr:polymerase ECF-type sigma factor [Nocardioidaceae bacterium]